MTAIKPRSARVTIYQGDDLEVLARLDATVASSEAAVKRAEKASSGVRLMTEGDPLEAAKQAHTAAVTERDQFAAEAEERGVVVQLHAQPRKMWRSLMDQHGPRDAVEDDKTFGVNMATLPDALLAVSIDRNHSTIEGDTAEFLESLSDYDYYDRLFVQAFALNRGSAMADPTQRLGSAPSQISTVTSS